MVKYLNRRQFIKTTTKAGFILGAFKIIKPANIFSPLPKFDLLIKNGQIIDAIQDKAYNADVGVVGECIEEIGTINPSLAKSTIDAEGKTISPGFIDIHSHTDLELIANPKAESKIRQGITTELSGNCGGSVFPIRNRKWTDLKGYHALLENNGTAVNHATLVGQGSVRRYVMGNERRQPTSAEMEKMKKLVAEAMRQGAFGLSTGLEYSPDSFSTTEEIIELCRVVSPLGGFYATHIRSEDTQLIEAIAEAIYIAENSGLPLQISHLKAAGRSNYYKIPMVFDLIERARKRELKVSADRYPYTAYSTNLNIMFPIWALEGGSKKFIERLKNKDLRQKMKEDTLTKAIGNNSWESMLIQAVRNKINQHLVGKYIGKAAESAGEDPYEFVCDLLVSEGGGLSIIGFGMSEENTILILKHPLVMFCTDGVALSPYGVLDREIPHPRNYGSFPRLLGLYVREKKILPLIEAIKKMTSKPAAKMGLKNRGFIRKGNFADLVIFNASTIADRATYLKPKQYSKGIDYVIVNGKIVVDHDKHTGILPGKVLC